MSEILSAQEIRDLPEPKRRLKKMEQGKMWCYLWGLMGVFAVIMAVLGAFSVGLLFTTMGPVAAATFAIGSPFPLFWDLSIGLLWVGMFLELGEYCERDLQGVDADE